jgi:hypothetical protein
MPGFFTIPTRQSRFTVQLTLRIGRFTGVKNTLSLLHTNNETEEGAALSLSLISDKLIASGIPFFRKLLLLPELNENIAHGEALADRCDKTRHQFIQMLRILFHPVPGLQSPELSEIITAEDIIKRYKQLNSHYITEINQAISLDPHEGVTIPFTSALLAQGNFDALPAHYKVSAQIRIFEVLFTEPSSIQNFVSANTQNAESSLEFGGYNPSCALQ